MKQIAKIEHIGKHPVFDIEVSNQHHYVLSNGILSHNSGLKYACSIILNLSKAKEKADDAITGAIISVTAMKSRLTREGSKVKTCLKYTGGLDRYYGLLDLALKAGIVKKVATRIEFPDGTKAFEKHINDNPEKFWTEEILKKIDEFAQKEFLYGNEWSLDSPTEALNTQSREV